MKLSINLNLKSSKFIKITYKILNKNGQIIDDKYKLGSCLNIDFIRIVKLLDLI